MQLHRHVISDNPLFRLFHDRLFVNSLVQCLKLTPAALPYDCIIYAGDIGQVPLGQSSLSQPILCVVRNRIGARTAALRHCSTRRFAGDVLLIIGIRSDHGSGWPSPRYACGRIVLRRNRGGA